LVMIPEIFFWIPVIIGLFGAIGLLRMKNVYTRIFASTMCSIGCTCLFVFMLAVKHFYSILSMKYLLIMFLIILTSPTASHAIANAAYKNRVDLKKIKKRRASK